MKSRLQAIFRRGCLWRRLRDEERGVTLIEFALVLPILIVLLIAIVEFGEAFTLTRKLSAAAGTVSDLVSQEASVNTAALNDISLVANEILKPYSTTPFSLVIVSLVLDVDNNPTVAWSHPPSAYAQGAAYSLPTTALTDPNSGLIVTEASYAFTPTLSNFLGSFQIDERAFFRPRTNRPVTKTN